MIHLRIISVTAALAYNRLCLVGTGIEKTGICDATLGKGPRIYGARNSLILLGNSFLWVSGFEVSRRWLVGMVFTALECRVYHVAYQHIVK